MKSEIGVNGVRNLKHHRCRGAKSVIDDRICRLRTRALTAPARAALAISMK